MYRSFSTIRQQIRYRVLAARKRFQCNRLSWSMLKLQNLAKAVIGD
ncbi:MAG: hypothetical protein P8178_00085 [Candidatus Thiodiazotropha sp.]